MKLLEKILTKKARVDAEIANSIAPDLPFFKRLWIYLDYSYEVLRYRINLPNYFQFDFYWRNNRGRRCFMSNHESNIVFRVCNPKEDRYITGNKAVFNRRFQAFLNRKWMDVSQASYEEFYQFVKDLDRFFLKPAEGERGIGTIAVQNDGNQDFRALYQTAKEQNAVVEEAIHQHPALAALNSSSVNTMRILTVRGADETVHVMGAALRIGRDGEIVDNFHHRGIGATIDVKSGVVISEGVDYSHSRFLFHPDSGAQIIGFQIPCWDAVIHMVTAAAKQLQELRFIGWDLTINDRGEVDLIEGNSTPGASTLQFPNQKGIWHEFEPLIEELRQKGLSRE